jgi:hypothetical protein
MPAFRYEAVDSVGATRKGVVNADTARSARADRIDGFITEGRHLVFHPRFNLRN